MVIGERCCRWTRGDTVVRDNVVRYGPAGQAMGIVPDDASRRTRLRLLHVRSRRYARHCPSSLSILPIYLHVSRVCRSRRHMGDCISGNARQVRYRRVVRGLLRVRRRAVADGVEIASDGDRLVHRRHRAARFPVHRSPGGLLESSAADHNGHAQRRRSSHVHLSAGNPEYSPAANDRGGRAVRSRLQALVLPHLTKVSIVVVVVLVVVVAVVFVFVLAIAVSA